MVRILNTREEAGYGGAQVVEDGDPDVDTEDAVRNGETRPKSIKH